MHRGGMGLKEENYIENDLKEIRSSKMWLIKSILLDYKSPCSHYYPWFNNNLWSHYFPWFRNSKVVIDVM